MSDHPSTIEGALKWAKVAAECFGDEPTDMDSVAIQTLAPIYGKPTKGESGEARYAAINAGVDALKMLLGEDFHGYRSEVWCVLGEVFDCALLASARPAPAQEKGEAIGTRNRFAIDWDCFVVEWAIEYIEKTADLTRKPEKADLLSALSALLARKPVEPEGESGEAAPAREQGKGSCLTCGWSNGAMGAGCSEPDFVSTGEITCAKGSKWKPSAALLARKDQPSTK